MRLAPSIALNGCLSELSCTASRIGHHTCRTDLTECYNISYLYILLKGAPYTERDVVPFFVARAISPGARGILREEKIGFYDLGGTLSILAPNTFV